MIILGLIFSKVSTRIMISNSILILVGSGRLLVCWCMMHRRWGRSIGGRGGMHW